MAQIEVVVREGLCVGCGACAVATHGRIRMVRNDFDFMQAELTGVSEADLAHGSSVCPFSGESHDESVLADRRFSGVSDFDQRIGYFKALFAGQISDQQALLKSSSGGVTSWLLVAMLNNNLIDGVVHLGSVEKSDANSGLFGFKISSTVDDLLGNRKSQYYSVSYEEALLKIRGDGKRYAVVGVPCYIRGARMIAERDAAYREQLKYFVALVCGHMKSGSFAELLAWQLGVPPDDLGRIDFRVKNPAADAGGYHTAAVSVDETKSGASMTRTMFGGNWGHAVFQLKSCDFCDDIFGETADVCFGDAWIDRYSSDWRGTNIAVVRDESIFRLLEDGRRDGALNIESISADDVVRSQDGNFRHRWDGLSVRLLDRQRQGLWSPSKRIKAGSRQVPALRRMLVRVRQRMSEESHAWFRKARDARDIDVFIDAMRPHVKRMDQIYRLMRIQDRLKRYWGRVFG